MRTRTRISASERCRGFTLLEILLVCVLIVLATSLTTSFLSGSDQKQFTVSLAKASALLRNSRRIAIVSGFEQEVRLATAAADEQDAADARFNDESDEIRALRPPDWLEPDMRLRYAATPDESFEEVGELALTFFPMGSSTGGVIEFSDASETRSSYLYVSPFTGKLLVEQRLEDLQARIEDGEL